jgi:phytoene desaturase
MSIQRVVSERSEAPARRAAVIGSGFGGISAAIRLAAAGFRTVLFEARDQPGGRAYVYRDKGFVFDAGPSVITVPDCLEELFTLTGRKMSDYVELLPVNPMYRIEWADGARFDYVNDTERLLAQIRRFNPDDVAGYRDFLAYSAALFETGYAKLVDKPFLHFADMVKQVPALARLRADRSVYEAVAKFIKDDHLRQALTFQALLIGGNPFDTSAIYALIHYLERKWGVFFPRGGTGALVRALIKLFEELGGEVRLSSPVRQIALSKNAGRTEHLLTTERVAREPFDVVVSNADLHHTYGTLYGRELRARPMKWLLERAEWTMSLVVIYFGVDRTYPDIAHHTVILGQRYRELLRDIFAGPSLPDDFSLYLHNPTVTDPSLAPPACASFYVLSPVPHLGKANVDWDSTGPVYANRILTALEKYMPNLRNHIVTQRIFTPRDFERELVAFQGSAFSLSPTLQQSAWMRPHNRDPLIPGLYIVGAGTHPGAGVPGVVNSAKATVNVVLEDFAP